MGSDSSWCQAPSAQAMKRVEQDDCSPWPRLFGCSCPLYWTDPDRVGASPACHACGGLRCGSGQTARRPNGELTREPHIDYDLGRPITAAYDHSHARPHTTNTHILHLESWDTARRSRQEGEIHRVRTRIDLPSSRLFINRRRKIRLASWNSGTPSTPPSTHTRQHCPRIPGGVQHGHPHHRTHPQVAAGHLLL